MNNFHTNQQIKKALYNAGMSQIEQGIMNLINSEFLSKIETEKLVEIDSLVCKIKNLVYTRGE